MHLQDAARAVLAATLCAPAIGLAQPGPPVPTQSFIPLTCEGGVKTRMNIVHIGPSPMVMIHVDGKWLDLRLVEPPKAGAWTFHDKTAEFRWMMQEQSGVLTRGDATVLQCTTPLPVQVIMGPTPPPR